MIAGSAARRSEGAAVADAERAAMFDHVWRRTRDVFYTKGYHGVDWQAVRPVYAKYLPHVGNNAEFAELLAELLGEDDTAARDRVNRNTRAGTGWYRTDARAPRK